MKKLVCEFIGTFFLVLAVVLSGNPLVIGLTLTVMVYTFGYISGGHYNPAVTIAIVLSKKMKIQEGLKYIAAQLIGGVAASVVHYIISGSYFITGLPPKGIFVNALLIEVIFTFALVTVIFNVAANKKTEGNQYYGLAIGLTIFIAAAMGGAISGGAFNPAVGIAPLLVNFSTLGSNWSNISLYLVGPILGSVLATGLNWYLQSEGKVVFATKK